MGKDERPRPGGRARPRPGRAREHSGRACARPGSTGSDHSARRAVSPTALYRVEELVRLKPAPEIALMRKLKRALDPDGVLNPGKVLPPEG
ncbi:MAG: FAD-binding oxidoreductase [Gemmatimonadetes bacterium]|nr:FAD-binding oxidoreductase [Gemmatimonadota bacterium]